MKMPSEDLAGVEALYSALDTSALLALLPMIDTLSRRVGKEIELIGGPTAAESDAEKHAALFKSVTEGLSGLSNQWPGSMAFEEIQAQVNEDRAKLEARAESGRAVQIAALDRAFAYSINLHQRRQLAIYELERRGVLPVWFSGP